ncbi:MAG: Transaldolase [Candidatus Gottesmanbacteria bacterium GW2011_GWA1_34_13]|uniref:Transaldolase n=1 Tax=Candidatus Gottesmanbacteria bacterium GW2011_GWA1_34_13 TaxID=1618434 RepID=A0A0G0AQW7_9BACT|nr:MAG: Transaldolase [Candidatus Gottesmanbacteria bacterium GW2011_GWA1_34_13]
MEKIASKIFIDSGDSLETKSAKDILGFIDGQTTNPTLIAKNPEVQKYLEKGKKLTTQEALEIYRKTVASIAKVTQGPISVQAIADKNTTPEEMIRQAKIYHNWSANVVVKFPMTTNGLAAAKIYASIGSVNLTLNFTQEQAAAAYQATIKAKHLVFVSPFVGRLDDNGENGMQLVTNELRMFEGSDHHVVVLTSSVRKYEHLLYALSLKSPAITIPLRIIEEWKGNDFQMPDANYLYDSTDLNPIPYKPIKLDTDWKKYNLHHPLTDAGIEKFMLDWKSITK